MGRVVGRLLMTADVTVQKCAVLPLSAMAMESGGWNGAGGTTRTVDKLKSEAVVETVGAGKIELSRVAMVGSPRRQVVVVAES
jgi:hypothetical protein